MINIINQWTKVFKDDVIKIDETKTHYLISINGFQRFAVHKKTGTIYGVSRGNVKKNECYGLVGSWEEWNWKPFYPHKKSLYNWKLEKENDAGKKKRTRKNLRKSSQWIKVMRAKLGLTQAELARELNVSLRAIQVWEQRGLPKNGMSAEAVKVNLERLLRERGESQTKFSFAKSGAIYQDDNGQSQKVAHQRMKGFRCIKSARAASKCRASPQSMQARNRSHA